MMLEEILNARNSFIGQFLSQWDEANEQLMQLVSEDYKNALFTGGRHIWKISRLENKSKKAETWEEQYQLLVDAYDARTKLVVSYRQSVYRRQERKERELSNAAKVTDDSIASAQQEKDRLEALLKDKTEIWKLNEKAIKRRVREESKRVENLSAARVRYGKLEEENRQLEEKCMALDKGMNGAYQKINLLQFANVHYADLESAAAKGNRMLFEDAEKKLLEQFSPSNHEALSSAIEANRALLKSEEAYNRSKSRMAIDRRFGDVEQVVNQTYNSLTAAQGRSHGWYVAGAIAIGVTALVTALTLGGSEGPVGPRGPAGIAGESGKPGQNYALTDKDKKEIADIVGKTYVITPAPTPTPKPTPTPTPTPKPASVAVARFETNYSVPKSLYDDAAPEARSNLVAALKPQAVRSGVKDLDSIMSGATKLEFSDTTNQVRIYTGSKLSNGVHLSDQLAATIGYSSEAEFDKVVATSVLPQFKTVPFISGTDYSVALKDADISKKLGAALVNVPITDRKGNTFVSHDPSNVISFLSESVGSYGLAQVEFGRDGNIRLLYQASADRVPFHTIRTTQTQQAVVMDAMLK